MCAGDKDNAKGKGKSRAAGDKSPMKGHLGDGKGKMGKSMLGKGKAVVSKGKGKGKSKDKGKALLDASLTPTTAKGVKGKGVGVKGKGVGVKGKGAKGKGVKGKSAKGKGGKAAVKGQGVAAGKGAWFATAAQQFKGKGRGESRKQRVSRVAADFAACVPDLMPEDRSMDKDELRMLFEEFCEGAGEPSSGFSTVLYHLVQWGVLRSARSNRFKLPTTHQQIRNRQADVELADALDGKRPPNLAVDFVNMVPRFDLPYDFKKLAKLKVYQMQTKTHELLEKKGFQPQQIPRNLESRRDYLHAVLFAEELQMDFDISIYDLHLEERLDISRNNLHKILVPGLAEKRPSVLKGDYLLLTCTQGKFRGFVHAVLLDSLEVSFHPSFQNQPPFKIHFSFNRTPLRSMHRAIDDSSSIAAELDSAKAIQLPALTLGTQLNPEQRQFLAACCKPQLSTAPLLLWGPPGTGKTTTLVHTIMELISQQPRAKVLVTAPSNPASDLLCERLSEKGIKSDKMFRLVAMMRDARSVAVPVLPFTRMDSMGSFLVPTLEELQGYQVIVCTCTTAAYLRSRLPKDQRGWFSHVFVDEAAQSIEAEALIPLTLAQPKALLCLAGDFKQLGPVIRSPVAIEYGLQVSLMERIVDKLTVDHSRVFSLLHTYRSHPSILKLYNKLIYADVLKCCCPPSSYDMERWQRNSVDSAGARHPLIFHHCNGEESRQKDSPSWQNLMEGEVVKDYLKQLLEYGVPAEDIGIITPYYKQCQRLRNICQGLQVKVEVGTTELFQGREKRVILMSTVRSRQEKEIQNDLRFSLGFLGNYKRTNVALSRAKSLLVVVGNMSLLSHDATWHDAIKLASDMGAMHGDLSDFKMRPAKMGDGSQWGASLSQTQEAADGVVDREWREHL